ncbi:NADH-quinone oxidoreductase subunit N [Sphingobacterium corticis]|uniref:NADH-quinone oxidoreductase subunit N n=1 Tax=Sphingobacterium corticis TaxID=1812823 RepID=A0ABW5NH02_9SPHI
MGAIITLSLLAILLLYLGLYNAKKALLPVALLGLAAALGFELFGWSKIATPQYSGMVFFDRYAIAFSVLCIVVTGLVLSLSKAYFKAISEHVAEYYALIIFSLVGALLVCAYHNFAILFIGIEVMSVALYILAGIRKRDRASNEAALKYFIMGAFSTGFLLFGITLLYGATGSFDLSQLQLYVRNTPDQEISPLFFGGILLLLVGLCFKIGAAPFHFWTPDVYEGSPILITAYMSTVVKVASFAGFLRLFATVLVPLDGFWEPVLLTIVIVTLFVGNISALVQSSFKRMLAYSSIAHAGYMLFAILSIGSMSASAILTYGFAYSLASVVAFAALMLVKRQVGTDQFESFNGLGKRNPFLAFVVTIAMLSLAGIPLTAGFVGKFMMFGRAMESYHTTLLVLAAINAVIGVFYYLRVVVHMYFKSNDMKSEQAAISVPLNFQIVFAISVLLTFVIGVYPDIMINLL